MPTLKAITVSLAIARPPAEVYHFVSNPENLPDWAGTVCLSIDRQEADWVMDTPDGQVKVRFTEPNSYGVLDHFVSPSPDVTLYVPMRVVTNGSGSEVSLTLFQRPGMTDEQMGRDRDMMERDLQTLKRLLEG